MKHKPIRVDWDELEVAFNNQNEELVYVLDLVTGHVELEGEGEEDDFDDEDDQHYERRVPSANPQRDDSTRARVEPLDTRSKLDWLERFLESPDLAAEAREELREAMGVDDPAPAISAVLRRHDEARDAWYLYRAEQLRIRMKDWLDERGVIPIDPPPWS